MRVSICGAGYVGVVASACLAAAGHAVIAVDISAEKVAMMQTGRSPIVEAQIDALVAENVAAGRLSATQDVAAAVAATDLTFIAVGTPSDPAGRVSLAAVDAVTESIGVALRDKPGHVVVMRSTVPPGTAEDRVVPILERASGLLCGQGFRYYSNPEFLREGTAVQDFHTPPYTLIGALPDDEAAMLRDLYGGIAGQIHVVPWRVAESVKYLANVYHAVKLAFANEAGQVLAAYGVDAPEAFRLFRLDTVLNVSPAYLQPGYAFGGSCLPKDLRSFLALAQAKDVATPFLQQLLPSNQALVERVLQAVLREGRQRVCLCGLAFKQGTDDLRESPFVTLAERLIGRGFDLRIHDRSVQMARLLGANRSYIDSEIPHLDQLLMPDLDTALDGARLVVLGHLAPDDRPGLAPRLAGRVVLDLAGLRELSGHPDIDYRGFCW